MKMGYSEEKLCSLRSKLAETFLNKRITKLADKLVDKWTMEILPDYSLLLIELCVAMLDEVNSNRVITDAVTANDIIGTTESITYYKWAGKGAFNERRRHIDDGSFKIVLIVW